MGIRRAGFDQLCRRRCGQPRLHRIRHPSVEYGLSRFQRTTEWRQFVSHRREQGLSFRRPRLYDNDSASRYNEFHLFRAVACDPASF
jgi:hypothetical protein